MMSDLGDHDWMAARTRIIRCPVCNLTVTVPAGEEMPDEGPTCQMGHAVTRMEYVVVEGGIGRES
jgi:hypothetical protein